MMRSTVLCLLVSALSVPAVAQIAGTNKYLTFPKAEIERHDQALLEKAKGPSGAANEILYQDAGMQFMLVARTHTGASEQHAAWADQVIVQTGEMTLIVGGKMVGGHTIAPGETRGTGVEGGEARVLHAGDIALVPVNVPHWVKVPAGKTVTYIVYKGK